MTEKGLISRLLCPKYGGDLTFGTLENGVVSAPGQPTIKDLLDKYNLRIDTKVFGMIGKPVGHSKSPLLFNKAFKSVGFNGVYVPFLVDDLAKFLATYASADCAGFSCTIPHKKAALKCCDEVDPIAKLIGAVNTVVIRPSEWKVIGYHTDYIGVISAIIANTTSIGMQPKIEETPIPKHALSAYALVFDVVYTPNASVW